MPSTWLLRLWWDWLAIRHAPFHIITTQHVADACVIDLATLGEGEEHADNMMQKRMGHSFSEELMPALWWPLEPVLRC